MLKSRKKSQVKGKKAGLSSHASIGGSPLRPKTGLVGTFGKFSSWGLKNHGPSSKSKPPTPYPKKINSAKVPSTSGASIGAKEELVKTETQHVWRARIGDYEALSGLKFGSEAKIDRAIDWVWEHHRAMPRAYPGEFTMIVPAEAVVLFQRANFEFELTPVRTTEPLTLSELAHRTDERW